MCALFAASVCLVLLGVAPAWANDIQYFDWYDDIPAVEVCDFHLDYDSMQIDYSSDITMTGKSADAWWGEGHSFFTADNYSGNGWVRMTFPDGATDVNGRSIDVTIEITNIVHVGRYEQDHGAFFNVYPLRWAGTTGFLFTNGGYVTPSGPGSDSMDVSITLRYADTGAMVPYSFLFGLYDLDVVSTDDNGTTTRESVRLLSGASQPVWLSSIQGDSYQGTGIDVTDARNGYLHGNHYGCDADITDNSYHCGFLTLTNPGQTLKFRWTGRDCETQLRLSAMTYPDSYVGTPTKDDAEGVQFDGERMSFDVHQYFPYAQVEYNPSLIQMTDTLDSSLDASSVSVKVMQGSSNVTNKWQTTVSGQTVTVKWVGSGVPMGDYTFTISAKVKSNHNFSSYSQVGLTGGGKAYSVPNQAKIVVNNYSGTKVVDKNSNMAHGKVSWGWVDITVSSANNKVSQLGQNSCYSLKGAQVGIYSDESCTKLVGTLTLDENGYGKSGRLPLGNYYIGEIKAPSGFADNETVNDTSVKGLLVSTVARENVPQSEDLDGSIVSKRDKELMEAGFRLNPLLQAVNNLSLY